ncbi:MAG: helix-turn-helix transcriptional regulator [Gallionellaceae bacterium]
MSMIRETRRALGLSQTAFTVWLAENTGRDAACSQSRVSEWEKGRRTPSFEVRLACISISALACAEEIGAGNLSVQEMARIIEDYMK